MHFSMHFRDCYTFNHCLFFSFKRIIRKKKKNMNPSHCAKFYSKHQEILRVGRIDFEEVFSQYMHNLSSRSIEIVKFISPQHKFSNTVTDRGGNGIVRKWKKHGASQIFTKFLSAKFLDEYDMIIDKKAQRICLPSREISPRGTLLSPHELFLFDGCDKRFAKSQPRVPLTRKVCDNGSGSRVASPIVCRSRFFLFFFSFSRVARRLKLAL